MSTQIERQDDALDLADIEDPSTEELRAAYRWMLLARRATCSPITLHAQPIPVRVVANRMSTGVLTGCASLHCKGPSPTRSRTALASPTAQSSRARTQ